MYRGRQPSVNVYEPIECASPRGVAKKSSYDPDMRIILPMALLMACGGGGGAKSPDAASIDGAQAADVALDAPAGPVALNVSNGGIGVAGITVYFQNADSSLVSETTTDSSGNASAVMVAGGFVTALLPQSASLTPAAFQQVLIETTGGVKPGDNLVIELQAPVAQQTVNFTAGFSVLGSGATYELFTTCPNTNGMLQVDSDHLLDVLPADTTCTTANVSVWSQSAGSVLVATDTAVAISANVALATTYAAPNQVTVSYTDVPAGITGIFPGQALHTVRGTLQAPAPDAELTVTGGAATGLLNQTTLAGSKAVTTTVLDFGVGAITQQEIIELAPVSASYGLDVGASELHPYTTRPNYAVATHSESWTEGTVGIDPDFHLAELGITRAENTWEWNLAVPRTGTTIAFPVLPTDIFDYNAGAGDTLSVELEGYTVPGGYDALRAFVFDSVDPVTTLGIGGKATHESL